MGGMAVAMALRLDESSGQAPHVPILMLLDRQADLHLAKRSAADAWLVKPLDALRLQRSVHAVLHPPAPDTGLDTGTADTEPADVEDAEAVAAG
jgi:DNA-binding response OmpR family regulator